MKKINDWFDDYSVCHQHSTNKMIHWLCVPLIYFSILMMLWAWQPWVVIGVAIIVHIFYFFLSIPLMMGMTLITTLMLFLVWAMPYPFWVGLALFVIGWVGQFLGHKIEGKKPAFFDDMVFLLIGPLWCLGYLYRKVKIAY